jgi:ParB-like chromosome segregation protein Spo0J
MSQIAIKYRKTEELKPAPYNPRAIGEPALAGLIESLKKFGMVDPIIVNIRTGLMVGGHQRLKAAAALGWTEVPTIEVDLSPSQEKALNVTLNNPKISGHYTEALQDILEELRVDFSEEELGVLKLDDLEIPNGWDSDTETVDKTEENLDGIKATIKVKCPQDIKDDVLVILKRAFIETSLEGVEII